MLCIIPLLCSSGRGDIVICRIKYFVSQRRASLVFLFGLILRERLEFILRLRVLAIVFKLGLPPFHRWLLRIIFSINYFELYLLFTLQKVIPLIILFQLGLRLNALLLVVIRGLGYLILSINSNCSIHNMLFLSSVGNGGFMLRSLIGGNWLLFLIGYSLILITIMIILGQLKLMKLRDLSFSTVTVIGLLALQFFNLGGVPPMLGFVVKLIVLKSLTIVRLVLVLLLLLSSFLVLYVYVVMFFQIYRAYATYNVVGKRGGSVNTRILPIMLIFSSRVVG